MSPRDVSSGPRARPGGPCEVINLAAERRLRGLAPPPAPYADPEPGDVVRLRDSGYLATVRSVHGNTVLVQLLDGVLSTFSPLRNLQLFHRAPRASTGEGTSPGHPEPAA